jgi:hypothetical protein
MRDTVLDWFGGKNGFEEIHLHEADPELLESSVIEEIV